jgi:hypothetical protein
MKPIAHQHHLLPQQQQQQQQLLDKFTGSNAGTHAVHYRFGT